jgi:F-box/leucine-rich repeat protein 10/11
MDLVYRYCDACTKDDPSRVVTLKTPARKSSRKRTQRDYANLNAGLGGSDPNRWLRIMENKVIKKAPFRKVKGAELDSWLEDDPEGAMKEPIIIEKPDGLGMKMPPDGLTVEHVAEYIGEDVSLEVIGASSVSGSDFHLHSMVIWQMSLLSPPPRAGTLESGQTMWDLNLPSERRY